MKRFIVGLDRRGADFFSSVIQYMELTNQPRHIDTAKEIYTRCISEILFHMAPTDEEFMYNIMTIPSWMLINFTENHIVPQHVTEFAHEVRSFALFIREKLRVVNPLGFHATYTLGHVDKSTLVVDIHFHDVPA